MSTKANDQAGLRQECQRGGLACGMGIFLPLGVVLSFSTGHHALMGAGVALALSLGMAFGEHLYQREIKREQVK
ncbi:MAG: hypothetical protein PVJ07_07760 [Anaerolineales bacterium]|jgi:hypothetical protein